MDILQSLADLLKHRNTIDQQIASLIGRPAEKGHIGEFVASQIFHIRLNESASMKDIDGYFSDGPLAGKSVNIKYYGKREGLIDMSTSELIDYYLVLTGSIGTATSSRGTHRPWIIANVYLFDAHVVYASLKSRNVKIGVPTSVRNTYWEEAEIFPTQRNLLLSVTQNQRALLTLFAE